MERPAMNVGLPRPISSPFVSVGPPSIPKREMRMVPRMPPGRSNGAHCAHGRRPRNTWWDRNPPERHGLELLSGQRARLYEVAYDLRGKKLVERLAFVLRGKTEYLLLCRYEQRKSSDACDTLLKTFRLR